jgi:hypothetical protein
VLEVKRDFDLPGLTMFVSCGAKASTWVLPLARLADVTRLDRNQIGESWHSVSNLAYETALRAANGDGIAKRGSCANMATKSLSHPGNVG